jgi:hypothetical protein
MKLILINEMQTENENGNRSEIERERERERELTGCCDGKRRRKMNEE